MSSTYNAITNLQEIEMDSLIVNLAQIDTALIENLDCNVGTIDTLNSTTATLTSANIPSLTSTTAGITTGNITTANITNNNSTNLNVSSLTVSKILLTDASKNVISSLYDESTLPVSTPTQTALNLKANINAPVFTTSIGLTSGNLTISSGTLLCNTITGTATNTNISLCTTTTGFGVATITLGNTGGGTLIINPFTRIVGNLTVETIRGNILTNTISLYLFQTGAINLGNTASVNPLTINNSTTLSSNKNLILQGTGKITTPNILVSGLTASKLTLTDASKNVVSSLYDETTLPVSTPTQTALNLKSNIDNPTFTTKITTPVITFNGTQTASKLLLTDASKNIVSSLYDETSLPVSTPQQTALNLKANINAPVFTTSIGLTSGNLTISSGKILSNTYTGLTTSSNLSLGESGDTGDLTLYKLLICQDIESRDNATTIYLFDNHLEYINFGNSSNIYFIQFNQSIFMLNSRDITINGTGKLTTPQITFSGTQTASKLLLTDASKNVVSSLYDETTLPVSTPTQTALNLKANINNPTFTGVIIAPEIQCPLYNSTNATTLLEIGKTSTTSNINIGGALSSGNLNLGVIGMTGKISCNSNVEIGTSASNKGLSCNFYASFTNSSIVQFCRNLTTGELRIGNEMTTGSITIGHTTPASDTGTLFINKNTTLVAGKALLTERISGLTDAGNLNVGYNNGSVGIISLNRNTEIPVGRTFKTENIQSNTATTIMNIGSTNTTANITIGSAQTSSNIVLGNSTPASDLGILTINKNVVLPANKSITLHATGGIILSPQFNSTSATQYLRIGDTNTSTNVEIGNNLTSGDVLISNVNATGIVKINNKAMFNTSISSSWINTGYAFNSTPKLFSGATLVNKYLTTTMWAIAPTSEWNCFESDTGGEGSALIQNGDTTCVINAGDQSTFWWLDEDTIEGSAGSTTYAWSGWKISTAGVFTLSSDRRLKRDITPIVDVDILDKLSLIEMVNYKWKAPSEDKYFKNGVERRKYKEVHTGYIAQDVRKIFPECVERENEDAYWTIKREDITSKFNLGVQELIKRDKARTQEIKEQQTLIDDLTIRLAKLEKLILSV